MHWHEFYEIEYLYEGSAYQILNGVPYDLSVGHLTFMSPLDFHFYESADGNEFKLSVCDIREDIIPEDIKELLLQYKPPYLLRVEKDSEIARLLDLFDHEFNAMRDDTTAKYIAYLLLDLVIKEAASGNNLIRPPSVEINDEQLTNIRLIMEFVNENCSQKLTRDAIAEQFNYSPNYLSKLFKKVSSISLFDYIISVRMEKARKLARDSDLPVSEIIRAVGYNSPSLFYKHYYERFETKPHNKKKTDIKQYDIIPLE